MTHHDWPIVLGDRGVLAPGRWRWARALGWMVALFIAAVAVTGLVRFTLVRLGVPAPVRVAGGLGGVVLTYLLYGWAMRIGEGRRPAELGLAPLPHELAIGLLIGAGMFAAVFAILRLAGLYTLSPGHWDDWPRDIVANLGVGLFEELLLRAIVFRLLMRVAGPWAALAMSALIFGALHLGNPNASIVAALAIAVEAGLMLASFYLLTGRIWMPVGVHIAWNVMQGPVFGARVSGNVETGSLFTSAPVPGALNLLSGGPFGPEASLIAMLVGLLVFGVVMAAVVRRRRPTP